MIDVTRGAAIIVRPPAIYGPGDRETLALFKLANSPIAVIPGSPRGRVAIAEVDDVAGVIVDVLAAEANGGTITIGGDRPEGYRWDELIDAAARAVGRNPVIISAPPWIVRSAGCVSEALGRWSREAPIFTSGKAREALHLDWSVSDAEQGMTAGRAYTDLSTGFARAVGWYRSHGWLR